MKTKSTKKNSCKPKRIVKVNVAKSIGEPLAIAAVLSEYNRWRRAEREYEWDEDPTKRVDFPYTPKELGLVIDAAAHMLEDVAGAGKGKVKGKGIIDTTCDCKDCKFRGMAICEHRKYIDKIAKLRNAVQLNNHFLGDVAGKLYDHDMHSEEDSAIELIRKNNAVLRNTRID